jgi:hypothetical protein
VELELRKPGNPGDRIVAEIDERHLADLFINVIPSICQRLERLEARQTLIIGLVTAFNVTLLAAVLAVVFDLIKGG